MKHTAYLRTILLIIICITANLSYAADMVPNVEAKHQALRVLKQNVVDSLNRQDIDTLLTYFSEPFAFTTVTQEVLTSKETVKDFYHRMLVSDDSPIKTFTVEPEADILTYFLNDNIGYCYGTSKDSYTLRRNGRTIGMKSRWTAVVVKENNQWKISVVHLGVDFTNNPILDANSMSLWRKFMVLLGVEKYPGEI
jgi:ketosteroid isomerase-like protein